MPHKFLTPMLIIWNDLNFLRAHIMTIESTISLMIELGRKTKHVKCMNHVMRKLRIFEVYTYLTTFSFGDGIDEHIAAHVWIRERE
jgi:hypothetical protein